MSPWPAGVVWTAHVDPKHPQFNPWFQAIVYLKAAWGKYTPAYVTGLPEGPKWIHSKPSQ